MSTAELLVILIVALIVFGPKKLPMLATHLGLLVKKFHQIKAHAHILCQQQLNELQLQDNLRKAKEADEQYEKERQLFK